VVVVQVDWADGKGREKNRAASATADFPCANVGCPVSGRTKVNQYCARYGSVWHCELSSPLSLCIFSSTWLVVVVVVLAQ